MLANILQRLAGEGVLASLGSWALSTGINCIFYLILLKFSLQVALKEGAKVELFSEMELDGAQVWRFVRTYLLTTVLLIAILVACFVPVLLMALLSAGVAVFSDQGAWKAFIGPGLACGALARLRLRLCGGGLQRERSTSAFTRRWGRWIRWPSPGASRGTPGAACC